MEQQSMEEESSSTSIEVDFDIKFKMMLIGDSDVGKTSLLKKYCDNEFSQSYISTIGIDFQIKNITIDNKKLQIQIWDTTGQERYQVLAKNYFNSSDGFVIVYDITKRESFDNVNNWIEQIYEMAPNYAKSILFGNKNDLKEHRQVKVSEGKTLAKKYNIKFFETSAKDGINIKEGFESLIREILGDIASIKSARKETISLRDKKHKKKEKEEKKEPCC